MALVLSLIIIILALTGLFYWLCLSSTSQVFGKYPWRIETTEKVVALTFDDGPNEPYTSQIADILAAHEIKATFFQVGACIERYPDVTKRLYGEGHIIGNHSLHHQFSNYLKRPSFEKEIAENQKIIAHTIGKQPGLFRSPWLMRQPWLFKTLKKYSLQPVSGKFCHPLEVFQPRGARIAKHALTQVKPGLIIIFHDGFDGRGGNRSQTVQAVQLTVENLVKQGYRFATISELLEVPAYLT